MPDTHPWTEIRFDRDNTTGGTKRIKVTFPRDHMVSQAQDAAAQMAGVKSADTDGELLPNQLLVVLEERDGSDRPVNPQDLVRQIMEWIVQAFPPVELGHTEVRAVGDYGYGARYNTYSSTSA